MIDIEIEYKQLLSINEYRLIFAHLSSLGAKITKQINYYFERDDYKLKKTNRALRIREKNGEYELCLKEKREHDLIENNIMISKEEFNEILHDSSLFNNYYSKLPNKLNLIGSLTTYRLEIEVEQGLYCLDKSIYNDIEDYELEFEACDYKQEKVFIDFLNQFEIEYVPNKINKIQRFVDSISKEGR